MPERTSREAPLPVAGHVAGTQFIENPFVLGRIDHDDHVLMVFGRGADHRRTTDVDLLDRVVERDAGLADGCFKWIEVHGEQWDRGDLMRIECGLVLRQIEPGQQTTMNGRMEGLDTSVQNLRKPCHIGDRDHGNARPFQRRMGAAGRDDLPAKIDQPARKCLNPGFVVNAQQRSHPEQCPFMISNRESATLGY